MKQQIYINQKVHKYLVDRLFMRLFWEKRGLAALSAGGRMGKILAFSAVSNSVFYQAESPTQVGSIQRIKTKEFRAGTISTIASVIRRPRVQRLPKPETTTKTIFFGPFWQNKTGLVYKIHRWFKPLLSIRWGGRTFKSLRYWRYTRRAHQNQTRLCPTRFRFKRQEFTFSDLLDFMINTYKPLPKRYNRKKVRVWCRSDWSRHRNGHRSRLKRVRDYYRRLRLGLRPAVDTRTFWKNLRLKASLPIPRWLWWRKRRHWRPYWRIYKKRPKRKWQKSRKTAGFARRFFFSPRSPWKRIVYNSAYLVLDRSPGTGVWWKKPKKYVKRKKLLQGRYRLSLRGANYKINRVSAAIGSRNDLRSLFSKQIPTRCIFSNQVSRLPLWYVKR